MTIPDDNAYRNVLAPLRPPETELAFRDGLTGLYNYRLLEQLLGERWSELVPLADRFSIVILDLDLFKDVNDRYGHLSGDEVLRETGTILRDHFRGGDFIFRYGGDEFVVLLPGADAAEASALGERARTAMLEAEFFGAEEQQRIEIPVSFSIGVAAYPADGDSGKVVLARADERLYAEKQALRRRIRRRRALILAAATVLVSAIALGVFLSLPSRPPGTVAVPPSVTGTQATAAVPSSSEDEQLLLARIAELQEEIARLTQDRKQSAAQGTADGGAEIEALQSQVRDLSDRLEARTAAAAAATDLARQSSDRAGSDRATPDRVPQERPAATPSVPADSRPEAVAVVLPKLLEPVIPRYPSLARERRAEATVEFRVFIDDEGRVVNATPVGSAKGLGFEEAARAAVLASRWKPGTRGGQPVPMETTLLVHFRIAG